MMSVRGGGEPPASPDASDSDSEFHEAAVTARGRGVQEPTIGGCSGNSPPAASEVAVEKGVTEGEKGRWR